MHKVKLSKTQKMAGYKTVKNRSISIKLTVSKLPEFEIFKKSKIFESAKFSGKFSGPPPFVEFT